MSAWTHWLNSSPLEWQFRAPPAGVEMIRRQLLAVLDDCAGFEADRVRWRLHTAERAQELWLMRDAVFQVVASQHCQTLAMQRIEGLIPAFRQVLPARLVGRA
jgi:hypothetical protein